MGGGGGCGVGGAGRGGGGSPKGHAKRYIPIRQQMFSNGMSPLLDLQVRRMLSRQELRLSIPRQRRHRAQRQQTIQRRERRNRIPQRLVLARYVGQ